MTLAAAFRCTRGGILLCSDQEWNDAGVSKRRVNKNYRISGLPQCEFFISGAGPDTAVIKAWTKITKCLWEASNAGRDVLAEHQTILESALSAVCKQNAKTLKLWPMSLLIIVAPRALDTVPMLYRTDADLLIDEPYYYAVGSGKPVADYLADRLYEFGRLDKRSLAIVAAFILKEAGDSSIGVGLGANMVFIHEGEKVMHYLSQEVIKEIQDGIPSLSAAINAYWPEHVKFTDWYAT
jgi:20S proteasome alpha/beta subunit